MRIPFYHLDAFARRPFAGNPAAVCPLDEWLDEKLLQAIAAELNLPATAFFAPEGDGFSLRWFTPHGELQLCGHATLASGFVILNRLEPGRAHVEFASRGGPLRVERDGDRIALDFPVLPLRGEHPPSMLAQALGVVPNEVWEADRGMAVLADAEQVRDLRPDIAAIEALPFASLIVTAPGFDGDCDFVSRYFLPKYGIAEDFVTGSAHCVLTPYWAGVLGKPKLFARQLSSRGGELWVEDRGERVGIAGECVLVGEGFVTLP
ncbi:MAG TPA: PhzF family phenazine biosynthesis protein [Candidatus Binatia bacterium]|nr:PhzF family phenazine biosynthesis protein [Candidatus Binatia bacterium]